MSLSLPKGRHTVDTIPNEIYLYKTTTNIQICSRFFKNFSIIERGLIAEKESLVQILSNVSYYYLSAYFYPFKTGKFR